MKEVLFRSGRIATMAEAGDVQAVLCRDGAVVRAGEEAWVRQACAAVPEEIDLGGARAVPAFVDSHSHITAYAQTLLLCSLSGASSFEEIVARLKDFAARKPLKPGAWLTGFGYDHNTLAQKRHPDRALLDAAFPDTPVMLSHASGHMGVVNTAGLRALGIAEDAPDPAGGKLGRDAAGRLTGYLEETAFTQLGDKMERPTLEDTMAAVRNAQKAYARYGILTTQDGLTRQSEWGILSRMAGENKLLLDVPCYVDVQLYSGMDTAFSPYAHGYRNHLRAAGYKLFLDGSPQGKTAWLTQPYEGSEERGYPVHTDEEVTSYVRKAVREGRQLLTHCNGDAAVEQLLRCCEGMASQVRPLRFTVIHGQCLRPDQLPRLKALGMYASFFTAHSWYWGDVHLHNLGRARAGRISPAGSALRLGVPFTFHQDTPVIEPNMLETMACAVERVTSSGVPLDADEKIGVMDALRAVTLNAAAQTFEEDRKGSLAPGKQCDLMTLSDDVLAAPEKLRGAKVTRVFRGGEELTQGLQPWT